MADRELLEQLSEPVVRIYDEMQTEMLENIVKRLAQDKSLLEDENFVEWHFRMLNQLSGLTEENIELIAKKAGIAREEIEKAIRKAGFGILRQNEDILQRAYKAGANLNVPPPLNQDTTILNILTSYQRQAENTLNLVNSTLIAQAEQAYRDILDRVVADVLTGLKTPQEALRDTVRGWAHRGLPALVDRAGRHWSVEGYVGMVVRTMSNRVANEMQEARFDEWGVDLVEVSSHMGARPLCAPYQGRIYSRSGRSNRYPNLYTDTSYGEPAGLFGINCGHVQYPYFPGLSKKTYNPMPAKQNERAYENSQRQRKLERDIRNLKREKRLMEQLGDEEGVRLAQERLRERQAAMRRFIQETGRTRRPDRERIY
jgi:DNA-binding phage protein